MFDDYRLGVHVSYGLVRKYAELVWLPPSERGMPTDKGPIDVL